MIQYFAEISFVNQNIAFLPISIFILKFFVSFFSLGIGQFYAADIISGGSRQR